MAIVLCGSGLKAQYSDVGLYFFGHSLLDHRPPAIETPSDETTVAHWMALLAEADGRTFGATGQYGFLPGHANLPPFSQWGYDIVAPVWESDYQEFAESDINVVMVTAANFAQWQGPDVDYYTDPGISPVSATLDIMDWVYEQRDDYSFYIYENWPDMAPYLSTGYPPSPEDFSFYNEYLHGEFHDWWIEYHDRLLEERPDLNVRMVPAGPILAVLLGEYLEGQIPLTELYEDDAPHGRATLYFLAALVNYMAVYDVQAPANFEASDLVHPVIRDRYQDIVALIWAELQAFNLADGTSRVFYDQSTAVSVLEETIIEFYPSPTPDYLHLKSEVLIDSYSIFASSGLLVKQSDELSTSELRIEIADLVQGSYFIQLFDISGQILATEHVVKI